MTDSYQELKNQMQIYMDLRNALWQLAWDADTMMPKKGGDRRTEIITTLETLMHEKMTDPRIGDWLDKAKDEVGNEWDKRNLHLIERNYLRETKIDKDLVSAIAAARGKTINAWQQSKQKSDWLAVQPEMEKLFPLIIEKNQIHAEFLGCSPYDAQMSEFANGNSQAVIDPLFESLQQQLPALMQVITEKQKGMKPLHPIAMPVATQEKIVKRIIEKMGYDFEKGRIDHGEHPGSYSCPDDGRITTHYDENNLLKALYGAIHETGHTKYTWNLPKSYRGQPVGDDTDMSLQESQSLLMERHVAGSDEFIDFIGQVIAEEAPEVKLDMENFKNSLRKVQPSYIRMEADEVNYPLHVILRYNIEKKLYKGDIRITDIPEIWNVDFKNIFGLDVKEHRLGCMQDVHWFEGSFGYFPTYTQGDCYASQLFNTAKKDLVDLPGELRKGNLKPLNEWLKENIHSQGQLYDAPDLIERATGEKPNAKYFLDHLKNRYL